MEREFEIGGRNFKLCKINPFKQFHIVRRVGPILAELIPAMQGFAGKDVTKLSQEDKLKSLENIASPVMQGLSKLSDSEADHVLFGLLSSVEVQQPAGNWGKVATESMLMMQDLELPVLLNIAGRAFMYNLSGFFSALPQQSPV